MCYSLPMKIKTFQSWLGVIVMILPAFALASHRQGVSGTWSGAGVVATFTQTGGHINYNCGSGEVVSRITLDRHGNFTASGHHESYAPGPMQGDSAPASTKVIYSGHVEGNMMTLDVKSADQALKIAEHYTLTRGGHTKLIRCL